MITYYKKIEVINVHNLCEVIQDSLSDSLVNIDSINVDYHLPSLQIRIRIKFDNSLQINMNLEAEEYNLLLCDYATQGDYVSFITHIRNKIVEMILKEYIK